MKKTWAEYAADAAGEIAKMSTKNRETSLLEVDLLAHPESTKVRELAFASGAPEQFLLDAVLEGNPGAMLVLARTCEARGDSCTALAWRIRAYHLGSAEAAYMLGMEATNSGQIKVAFEFLKSAYDRRHPVSPYALANVCQDCTADDVDLTVEEFTAIRTESSDVAQRLMFAEALDVLGEGTHPVQYRDALDIPWGTGTLFMVRWKGVDLAITAKHVIKAAKAMPDQVQIIVHQQEVPLPLHADIALDFRDSDGDLLDVHVWKINSDADVSVEWNSWNLETFCKSANQIPENSTVFVVGFPNTEDKIDFEERKMRRAPLVVKGRLGPPYGGLHSIICAEFSTDVDGVSGGPVFCRHGGVFYFIGISQLGGTRAQTLYFLDSSEILPSLDTFVAAATVPTTTTW
ncbi:trypsin-like serine protease [Duganella sp. Leaf61]|uniref:trypsin-like serine protease n=1 Tax=Duganella sp. Leaf61 TaxID=1736227 RepID=UPI0009EBF2D6|nr:trypsin-like serine protease [Duganella sp. Leaf61]